MRPRHATLIAATTLLFSTSLGCDQLLTGLPGVNSEQLPDVQVSGLQLRDMPTLNQLGAYYCPKVIGDPFVALGCAVTIGPPPPKSQMVFSFGVNLTMANPNDFPIPALDVLLGLTLFEAEQSESLGAICVSLCGQDDPECDGTPKPGACEASQNDIRTIDDFVNRIPQLISDLATGRALDELKKSTIAAGGNVQLDLEFALGIDEALGVFEKTALTYVQDLLANRSTDLVVPVAAEGSVFFQLPILGRIGVGYGPLRDDWQIF